MDWLNIIRKIIIAGILATLPLALLGDYGDLLYPFGRNIIFQAITEILLIFYFALILIDKNSRPDLKSPLMLAAIFLWLLNLLAFIFSMDRPYSFFGDPRRMAGFFNLSHVLAFFLIIASILKSWQDWKKVFYLIVIISIPASLYAVWQYFFEFNGNARALGTLDNPNFLAAYLIFPIFLSVIFLCSPQKNTGKKIFFLAALFFQLAAFYFAFSRGALIALSFGIFLFVILNPKWRLKFKLAILALLIVSGFGFLALNLDYIQNQIQEPNNYYRLEIWRNAILGIKEKPMLGWGQENFQMAFDKYYTGLWEQKETMGAQTDKAHNIFLETAVTTGIPGLLAYFAIWIIAFRLAFKRKQSPAPSKTSGDEFNYGLIRNGILAILAAYLIQGLFNIETLIPALYFWLIIGFLVCINRDEHAQINGGNAPQDKNNHSNLGVWPFLGLLILTGLMIFSTKNYHLDPFLANINQNKAKDITLDIPLEKLNGLDQKTRETMLNSALNHYKNALDTRSFMDPYIRFHYGSTVLLFANLAAAPEEESKKLAEDGLRILEQNLSRRPFYVRDWWLAGQLSNVMIALADNPEEKNLWLKKSDGYFGQALAISPKRPIILTEWGQAHLTAGDLETAREKFRQAISINPNLPEPHWFLAISHIQDKNWTEFERELEISRQSGIAPIVDGKLSMPRLAQLANAFLEQKEYRRLTELYEMALEKDPQNIQLYISLAVAYKEDGQKEKARQTIERLFQIDPQLREHPQIQTFLQDL